MPSLSDVVNVTVLTEASQISRAGYGTCLILGGAAAARVETTLAKTYTSPSELLTAGYLATDPEYLAAVALMAQSPCPASFKVAKRSNLPTQSIKVTPTAQHSTAYVVSVDGVNATYTSDSSATVAEITAGLKTAIDALAPSLSWVKNTAKVVGDKIKHSSRIYECITAGTTENADNVGPAVATNPRSQDITDGTVHWKFIGVVPTTTDGTTYLTVAAPIAGEFMRIVPADLNLLRAQQSHVNNAIATDLAAIELFDADWYALVDCFPSHAATLAAAAWIETAKKMLGVAATDAGICSSATDDIATAIKAAAYARTFVIFHPDHGYFAEAAWLGARLPLDPGSETWGYVTLAGVPVVVLTPSQQNYATGLSASAFATGKAANIYVAIGGQAATWPGIVGAREFIDKIRGTDAMKNDMQVNVYERLVSASNGGKKIPFTDSGIAIVKAAMAKTLSKYVDLGFLTEGTTFVTAPSASAASSSDKQARRLTGVKAGGVIAGAIHELVATVTLTY
jgi:hypothetical protein